VTGIFLFTLYEPFLGPVQLPIQWVVGVHFPGVKWQDHEADHLILTSVKVKNVWSFISTPSFFQPYSLYDGEWKNGCE
jgi:hypothetical protein